MTKDEAIRKALGELQVGFIGNAMQILREALAEQPAQQALNKMAENARELGLDYEPDIPFGDNNPGLPWDEVPQAFNDWWNADYDPTGNPFEKDTHAYWAWAGWKAAEQPAQQEPVLQEIEQYRLQMAGISTAAIGYWKESDGIHPDYDTVALRDVAKLYAKYDELYRAQPQPQQEPVDSTQISKVWWDGEKLMAKPIPFVEFYEPAQRKESK